MQDMDMEQLLEKHMLIHGGIEWLMHSVLEINLDSNERFSKLMYQETLYPVFLRKALPS